MRMSNAMGKTKRRTNGQPSNDPNAAVNTAGPTRSSIHAERVSDMQHMAKEEGRKDVAETNMPALKERKKRESAAMVWP